MDWDDEEESTHVYDKAEDGPRPPSRKKASAAAALLASSGGTAPAARAPLTAPAASPGSVPPPPPVPEVRRDEPTAIRPRAMVPAQQSGGRIGIVLSAVALAVAVGLAIFMLLPPKRGEFTITVAYKSGANPGAVDIFIDGQKKCEASPCKVRDLEPGSKSITASAPGFVGASTTEAESGREKVVTITLEPSGGSGPGPVAAATGQATLRIGGTEGEHNVHVLVDGTDRGSLPLELKDLAPGSHKVRFDGGDRYEKMEQTFDVTPGQVKELGEIRLKVLKGQVKIDLQTSGALVTLVKRGDKKIEKKVNDPDMLSARKPLDIDPTEGWRIVASKRGYDDYSEDLTFEDGQADKTIHISLNETGKSVAIAPPPPGPAPDRPAPDRPAPEKKAPETSPPASGTGTLNINSIPVSKVVLDGKPLGSTPKVGVSVPAGSHTVTFIHPDLGKQTVTVVVKGGETKTAAVKFKQP
jgi:PEGA domain